MKVVRIVVDNALVSVARQYHLRIIRNIIDGALVSTDRRYQSQIGRLVREMKRYWRAIDIANTLSPKYKKDPNIGEPSISQITTGVTKG